jgi:hypothetical protein
MSENYLAIASVPMQQWGKLYSKDEAFNIGTIFQDLNMPFFAAENVLASKSPIANKTDSNGTSMEQANREVLITKINEASFFQDDLTLYLDTHENDVQALRLYQEVSQELAQLRQQFALEFYPLTRLCIPFCKNQEEKFCWQEGPMPWEGACV